MATENCKECGEPFNIRNGVKMKFCSPSCESSYYFKVDEADEYEKAHQNLNK